jgi:hypothetical protein
MLFGALRSLGDNQGLPSIVRPITPRFLSRYDIPCRLTSSVLRHDLFISKSSSVISFSLYLKYKVRDCFNKRLKVRPENCVLAAHPCPLSPQWSGQKRPTVVRAKPANGRGPGLDSFSLSSLDPASLFSFSSSVVRISGCDRGVADGPAWR